MNCGQGVIQTHGMCWFYSMLNGFLLSEGGQKLLYEKMVHFYRGLTPEEKAFFKDGIDAPCPRGSAFKPIYFYKFLDQFLCFMSGPRAIKNKPGLSPEILNNLNLINMYTGKVVNAHTGSHPNTQIIPLLDRIGFTEHEYYTVHRFRHFEEFQTTKFKLKPKIIICDIFPKWNPEAFRGYELMCTCLILQPDYNYKGERSKSTGIPHAITGYMCNSKPYIFDSNFRDPIPCKWWNDKERSKALEIIKERYKKYKMPFIGITAEYSIFVRRSALRRIHPACLLKYRNASAKAGTPAEQSAIKRQNKRHNVLKFFFPRKRTQSLSPSVLPVPNSKSPMRTRSRGVGKPRKKVP